MMGDVGKRKMLWREKKWESSAGERSGEEEVKKEREGPVKREEDRIVQRIGRGE